jgi:hypothetical protein
MPEKGEQPVSIAELVGEKFALRHFGTAASESLMTRKAGFRRQ